MPELTIEGLIKTYQKETAESYRISGISPSMALQGNDWSASSNGEGRGEREEGRLEW